jgi:membrane protease YdiL (CAAX protease family)
LEIPEKPGLSMLESFAIYITGLIVLPALVLLPIPGFIRIGASILSIFFVILAIFWPRIREVNWKEYRAAIGWQRGRGFFREIGCGIIGYLAGLPLLAFALAIVLLLSRYTGVTPSHPLAEQVNRDTFFLMFILACVWAPVTEETFFRGMFFGYLRRRFSWVSAGIISALLFALVHPQGLLGTPVLGVIGFTMSAIREWRGSLIASMSAHALNNGSALLMLFMLLD